ncbi:conserved protein of unknown function [Rhodovastum atsumiense]|uniref:DUF721 domain-containing protein n=1 Tax=Rhodovastum atsumiense TaxID=504468 RepID=A0A5M6IXF3_9PROT|nr:DciA family protein [Rhodovastum atsumiense]KAA5613016.1 DUF721 domain-containing protein [Rhodovastum atsumiense]CAH2600133.1 conserved protein of unknown function [Rhodovastum atsumiense]
MGADQGKDKQRGDAPAPRPEPARFVYGPRPIGALVPALLKPSFRRRAPATAQLVADWEMIIGPRLAAETMPRKLTASGTLTIACTGPVAMELQHLSETVKERINGHLGKVAVTQLRFVQDPPPAARPAPPPPPQAVEAARQAVESLPPGPLRDAIESLGRVVLSGRKR